MITPTITTTSTNTTMTTPTIATTPTTTSSSAAAGCGAVAAGVSAADGAASAAALAAAGAAGGECPGERSGRPSWSPFATSPAHGYEVMRRLEEMSGGLWRPSPGSVYPHLQMLEDEGLVQSSDVDGSRTYTLTDAGRAEAEKTTLPWQATGEADDQVLSLRQGMGQLMSAAKQLAGAGEKSQIERGIAVIQKARKELYQILAED